jgi:hypothetical protein
MPVLSSGRATVCAAKAGCAAALMAAKYLPPGAYEPSSSRRNMKSAVYSVPAVPMTEPIASLDRSRSNESGRRTNAERRTIHALGVVSRAGAPTSFAIDANESPTMIE